MSLAGSNGAPEGRTGTGGELLCLGISYKAAPVALRERAALTAQQALRFTSALCEEPDIREAVAISTCNRTELYLVVGDAVAAEGAALAQLASCSVSRRASTR